MESNNEKEEQGTEQALPLHLGMNSDEVEEISQEITGSGVTENEADVERLGVPGPDSGEDVTGEQTPAFPVPIVTSD